MPMITLQIDNSEIENIFLVCIISDENKNNLLHVIDNNIQIVYTIVKQ